MEWRRSRIINQATNNLPIKLSPSENSKPQTTLIVTCSPAAPPPHVTSCLWTRPPGSAGSWPTGTWGSAWCFLFSQRRSLRWGGTKSTSGETTNPLKCPWARHWPPCIYNEEWQEFKSAVILDLKLFLVSDIIHVWTPCFTSTDKVPSCFIWSLTVSNIFLNFCRENMTRLTSACQNIWKLRVGGVLRLCLQVVCACVNACCGFKLMFTRNKLGQMWIRCWWLHRTDAVFSHAADGVMRIV